MINRMIVKSVVFSLIMFFAIIPTFSQTITIEKSKLEEIIRTESQKYINEAVDKAVAIAVKDVEAKYIIIIGDLKKKIVELMGTIDKQDIHIQALNIDLQNEKILFYDYKKDHGIKRDLIIGTTFTSVGVLAGILLFTFIK
jgi:hypothetical protein